MLWNAPYQHDPNNAAGQKQRKAYISHQVDPFDESKHDPGEGTPLGLEEDDSSHTQFCNPLSILLSLNSVLRFPPNQLWGEFPEAAKEIIIECNKKVKVANPTTFGGNPKPKSTLGKPNPKTQQVHLHENDHPPENHHSEDSTQAMVH